MNYFITHAQKLHCFYRGADGSIYMRTHSEDGWSRALCIISDVRPHYTVYGGTSLSVICQGTNGNIFHCVCDGDIRSSRLILESKSLAAPDMLMHRLGSSLLYNLPQSGEQTLIIQNRTNSSPKTIDSFAPFSKYLYRLFPLGKNGRTVLVYRKNSPRQKLVFRIVSEDGTFGDPVGVYSSNAVINDVSMAYDGGFVHFAFSVRGRLSSRLLYVRAAEEAAAPAVSVWEGNMENTCVRSENGKLTINCSSGKRLYTFIGENDFRGSDIKNTGMRIARASFIRPDTTISDIPVPADRPYDTSISFGCTN